MALTATTDQDTRRRRTVLWVVSLATVGLIFDGYDLVVYGAVVSTFLKDPSQLGEVTPAMAGTLGSYALLGMMFGALLAGAFGDILGRRKVMLISYAWFSVGMFITALMSTTTTFGVMRFLTGLGIGALIATTATLITEIAAGEEEFVQRDLLRRRSAGEPAGGATGHPVPGRHRLARTVHDRGSAHPDAAAAGAREDARVGAVVGRPGADRRGVGSLRANRSADSRQRPRVGASRKGGPGRPVQPPLHLRDGSGG